MLGAVSAVSPLPAAYCRLQFAALCRLSIGSVFAENGECPRARTFHSTAS